MINAAQIDAAVRIALEEDAPWGDLSAEVLLPAEATMRAELIAREDGVFSGGEVFAAAFTLTDARITVADILPDGGAFRSGDVLARVAGPARGILQAERIGLNFCQRMSGIATLTAAFVAETRGTRARIVDTRKTTPGLRSLERHAVTSGGGRNHRRTLSDAVMVKDNHWAVLTRGGRSITEALLEARAALPHTVHLEVEVDRLEQIPAVLAAGVDTIMLDNFRTEDLRAGVELIAGAALVEASGNMTRERIAEVAATGVDIISVGALTHSARALDLGLDIRPER